MSQIVDLHHHVIPDFYWEASNEDGNAARFAIVASAFSDTVVHMLRSVTGLENVVFGTDYPYPRDAISIGGLRHLQRTAELDDGERRGVVGDAAARLIPRLARVRSAL
jgi:hypothetical protein